MCSKNNIFFGYGLTQADVSERLGQINPGLAAEARKVLDLNKSERHIRGGLATKEKYLHILARVFWKDKRG